MSFDKIEVRVFSGPDQVQVGSNTEPDLIVMNIGPKGDTGATGNTGATGPAGPNSVTSATTSDGTAILDVESITGIYIDGDVFTATSGTGTAVVGTSNSGIGASFYSQDNYGAVIGSAGGNSLKLTSVSGDYYIECENNFTTIEAAIERVRGWFVWFYNTFTGRLKTADITADRDWTLPDASGNVALTASTTGVPDKLTDGTIAGTTTFNSTSYTYGTGAAAAHRTALGLGTLATQNADAATLSGTTTFNGTAYTYGTGAATAHKAALELFTLLTVMESDIGNFVANGASAVGGADGDSLNLTTATANLRPNVYRFRNWNRNPGNSGAANVVMPVSLASAGNIIHAGAGANGASFRCGIGMVNGASAVAADANATTGRGFGWRIAWNSSTSKLEFNLWAHNGTTYVEGTGIDTGLGAVNLDGFFNVIVRLDAAGIVTAHTWFGNNSAASVPSLTPTVTLAGGPTSGAFANQGIPLWLAATHSTVAPLAGQSIIAKILNRKLILG